jgi:hypothetical protein
MRTTPRLARSSAACSISAPIVGISGQQLDASGIPAGHQSIAVVLDLVNPVGPGRRLIGRGGLAGSLRLCDILPYQPYRCSRIAFSASDFAKRLVHLSRPAYQFSRALF